MLIYHVRLSASTHTQGVELITLIIFLMELNLYLSCTADTTQVPAFVKDMLGEMHYTGVVASFLNSFICGRYEIVTTYLKSTKMSSNTKIEIRFALLLGQASNCLESFSEPRLEELHRNPDKGIVRIKRPKAFSVSQTFKISMFPAYFSIRYHRLEATAKKWISESVLFRRVFTLAATVLFPHRILKVLESFWVPQSLWLES